MRKKECIAMLLAGGQGSRLGPLTKKNAKPAVSFGGKYRIIDFSLSNCVNSGIDTVGVLTQYKPLVLNAYLGTGEAWDLDSSNGGVHVLPPFATETGGEWYEGTADAIYHNIDFIDSYDPDYVLILSGDHLYKMDYSLMLEAHKKTGADLTVSVMEVSMEEACRFGIMTTDENMRITEFEEKPANPRSTLASMGIYIFTWPTMRKALLEDHSDSNSDHDFGKNIIPNYLSSGKKLFAYRFSGYWKDVGTIESYYEAQLALLSDRPEFDVFSKNMRIYSNANIDPPHYIGSGAVVQDCLISNGCTVLGYVDTSVLSSRVQVGEDAHVERSILLPDSVVEPGARVVRAILGEGAVVEAGAVLGSEDGPITVIGDNQHIVIS